jgi:hypothetical protein
MTRRTRTADPRRPRPAGVMANEYAADMCTGIATPKGCEGALRAEDWRSLQRQALDLMQVVRTLDRPACPRDDCQDEADAVIDKRRPR